MINGEIKKTYRINEQQAKGEWVYSGSTVALQWLYSGSTVGLQWVYSGSTVGLQWLYNEQKTNDERRNSEPK